MTRQAPGGLFAFKSWALHRDSCLSPSARLVGLILADHMWNGFSCRVSFERLAEQAGLSRRAVCWAVSELLGKPREPRVPPRRKGAIARALKRNGGAAAYFERASGSKAGAANGYTLRAQFRVRRPADPGNSCTGRQGGPVQKTARTRATVARETPMKLLTEETPSAADAGRVEGIRERLRRIG